MQVRLQRDFPKGGISWGFFFGGGGAATCNGMELGVQFVFFLVKTRAIWQFPDIWFDFFQKLIFDGLKKKQNMCINISI